MKIIQYYSILFIRGLTLEWSAQSLQPEPGDAGGAAAQKDPDGLDGRGVDGRDPAGLGLRFFLAWILTLG